MPIFSGESSRLVHVDANAVIDYVREFTLHKLGMRGTGHRAEVLRVRLGQVGPVLVAETAGIEAERNLEKDLAQKLGRGNLRYVSRPALKFLRKYLTAARVKDNIDRVHAAREMYALISSDPHNEKFSHWKKKKGEYIDRPALGSDVNDLTILSTAAHFAQKHAVELWTHDMDFTMFGDEIWRAFRVKVVDTYRLDAGKHA